MSGAATLRYEDGMSDEMIDLSEQFPVSPLRVLRRSLGIAIIFSLVTLLIVVFDFLGPDFYRVSLRTFSLLSAGAFLSAAVLLITRIVYEWIWVLLHRCYLSREGLLITKGVLRTTCVIVPLSEAATFELTSGVLDGVFGLWTLSGPGERPSAPNAIEGLRRESANGIHKAIVNARPDAPLSQTVSGDPEAKIGRTDMTDGKSARSQAAKQKIEQNNTERTEIEKATAKQREELEKMTAEAKQREELTRSEAEKARAAEELRATEIQLREEREKHHEEEKVQAVKEALEKTRHELELVRQEKELKAELEKTEAELEKERRSLESSGSEQKAATNPTERPPSKEGAPQGVPHYSNS